MDNKGASFGGSNTGKIIPFPGSENKAIEQSGAIFGGENDEAEAFYSGNNAENQVIASGNSGESLVNAGPNYGESIAKNETPENVVDFATEVDRTLAAADLNKDGVVSATEQMEYMDDQEITISKNLKKLTDKQVHAVEKDIDRMINKGDAYGAVVSRQRWSGKLMKEAFNRSVGDGNVA